jgi:hypothetical protein
MRNFAFIAPAGWAASTSGGGTRPDFGAGRTSSSSSSSVPVADPTR